MAEYRERDVAHGTNSLMREDFIAVQLPFVAAVAPRIAGGFPTTASALVVDRRIDCVP